MRFFENGPDFFFWARLRREQLSRAGRLPPSHAAPASASVSAGASACGPCSVVNGSDLPAVVSMMYYYMTVVHEQPHETGDAERDLLQMSEDTDLSKTFLYFSPPLIRV